MFTEGSSFDGFDDLLESRMTKMGYGMWEARA